ncbi:MAG: hypothetical protein OHK0032_09290 [Thermodesulfovibrionales bacterium]
MKANLLKLWNSRGIGFKLTTTFISLILIPMLLLSYASYRVMSTQAFRDIEEKLNITLRAAWNEYYERAYQMRYGMLQATAQESVGRDIRSGSRESLRKTMKEWKKRRPYVDIWSVVDAEGRVIARLNSELSGDALEINGLVKKALTSGEPQISTEVLPGELLKREGEDVYSRFRVQITDEQRRTETGYEDRALALVVVVPFVDDRYRVIGAIITADILNNDSYIPDEIADMTRGLSTTISMNGIRIATNLKDRHNQSAAGTMLPVPVIAGINSGTQKMVELNIGGHSYMALFNPIKDHKGNIIGSFDVSVPKSIVLSSQRDSQKMIALITLIGIAMALLAAFIATRRITTPLKQMKDKALAFAKGDMDARVDIETDEDTRDETVVLARTFNIMIEEVRKKGEEKEQYLKDMEVKNRELGELNERLKAANEELEVAFEELQSQTEEVQAANEELRVLNEDMEKKNAELLEANRIIKDEEEELKRAKGKLRLIYDTIRDYILLTDKDLTVLEANRCFIEDMRLEESRVIGRVLCHIFGIEDSSKECPAEAAYRRMDYATAVSGDFCPVKRAIRDMSPVEMELKIGEKIYQWRSFPYRGEAEGNEMAVVYIKDITEQRLLMQRLIQSDKLSSIGELVSGVAHELNNPLTSIMGFSELLLGEAIDEKAKKRVGSIYESSQRCKRIIDNLLTFARVQKPERTYEDLNSLITKTVELKLYELRVNDIDVELDLDPSLPRTMADGYQLQQVFLNLLNNAQHAIKDKGVRGKITIRSRCENNRIVLSFSDSGTGIPENIISRIFDPFFTTKDVGKGTGLGLSISYGIIKEHGGSINVISRQGEGATFIIDLPVIGASDKDYQATSEPAVHDAEAAGGLSALILDDEPAILDVLNEVLIGEGFHVETMMDARKAVERLRERDFDLIISDIRMPDMDGKQFYREIKAMKPYLVRKIIFISGDTVSRETQDFLNVIGNYYLKKPFEIKSLRELISKLTK